MGLQQALGGLQAANGDQALLRANARTRQDAMNQDDDENYDETIAANPGAASMLANPRFTNDRMNQGGNVDAMWAPFYEALQEKNARIAPQPGHRGDPMRGLHADAPVANDPQWWLNGQPPAATPSGEADNEQMMPPALRGLYRAQYIKQ